MSLRQERLVGFWAFRSSRFRAGELIWRDERVRGPPQPFIRLVDVPGPEPRKRPSPFVFFGVLAQAVLEPQAPSCVTKLLRAQSGLDLSGTLLVT